MGIQGGKKPDLGDGRRSAAPTGVLPNLTARYRPDATAGRQFDPQAGSARADRGEGQPARAAPGPHRWRRPMSAFQRAKGRHYPKRRRFPGTPSLIGPGSQNQATNRMGARSGRIAEMVACSRRHRGWPLPFETITSPAGRQTSGRRQLTATDQGLFPRRRGVHLGSSHNTGGPRHETTGCGGGCHRSLLKGGTGDASTGWGGPNPAGAPTAFERLAQIGEGERNVAERRRLASKGGQAANGAAIVAPQHPRNDTPEGGRDPGGGRAHPRPARIVSKQSKTNES